MTDVSGYVFMAVFVIGIIGGLLRVSDALRAWWRDLKDGFAMWRKMKTQPTRKRRAK